MCRSSSSCSTYLPYRSILSGFDRRECCSSRADSIAIDGLSRDPSLHKSLQMDHSSWKCMDRASRPDGGDGSLPCIISMRTSCVSEISKYGILRVRTSYTDIYWSARALTFVRHSRRSSYYTPKRRIDKTRLPRFEGVQPTPIEHSLSGYPRSRRWTRRPRARSL